MADKERDLDDRDLAALFDAAQTDDPVPSAALMARIAADALGAQAGRAVPSALPLRDPLWTRINRALGGWQALGTLTTATAVGVVIGISGAEDLAVYVPGVSVEAPLSLGAYDSLFDETLEPEG